MFKCIIVEVKYSIYEIKDDTSVVVTKKLQCIPVMYKIKKFLKSQEGVYFINYIFFLKYNYLQSFA